MNITIIGAGAWGTAVATVLAHNDHEVTLWAYEQEVADEINARHENSRYLPNVRLSERIVATSDLAGAVEKATYLFVSVPVAYMRAVLTVCKTHAKPDHVWVLTSKGIEQETLMLPSQILDDVLGYKAKKAVVAGPSFARDVAAKDITGVALACEHSCMAATVQKLLINIYFRPYLTEDLIGVQVAAALKNVLALGIGMLEGAGFADNAKALFLTLGLREAIEVGYALGAYKDTFYGLAGVGDLVLTSFGTSSRNLLIGRRFGRGVTLQELEGEHSVLPEGINTAASLYKLIERHELNVPILAGIYQVIYEQRSLHDMLAYLMSRSIAPRKCCE
jgi:glycerol-3-phosphate dehydrogenase (NAD(P)+)